jgi:hypothetical protein
MATLFPTLGNFDYENPYLAGRYGGFDFETPYVDFSDIKTEDKKKKTSSSVLAGKMIGGVPLEDFNELSSGTQTLLLLQEQGAEADRRRQEERDPAFLREQAEVLDEVQAKQMARAQKYGKESAFYGFMYQGLPKLMAQAAFSRYAFAPEMVKGVQEAYSRMNLARAIKPSGAQSYMSVNPMGGIG